MQGTCTHYELKLPERGRPALFSSFRDAIFPVSTENNNKCNPSTFPSCFLIVSYSRCFKFLTLPIRPKGVSRSSCCGISQKPLSMALTKEIAVKLQSAGKHGPLTTRGETFGIFSLQIDVQEKMQPLFLADKQ